MADQDQNEQQGEEETPVYHDINEEQGGGEGENKEQPEPTPTEEG